MKSVVSSETSDITSAKKRLVFSCAWRSVVGMKPNFSEGFQGFHMHGPELPLPGGSI